MTQKELIQAYMENHNGITDEDARREFGCHRLAARIAELKRDGLKIRSEFEKGNNRYGKLTNYKRYFIEEQQA